MAKRRIIPLFIPHAGCPQTCVFCDQRKISGADTPVTPAQVAREIEASLPRAGRGCELAFYGGSFTAMSPDTQERLLGAAQPYLGPEGVGAIRLSTRPDAVDDQVCRRLRAYHVSTVELGCQSMDDQVLALSRRGHTGQDTVQAVECLRRHGLSVILQMMTGLPGDTGAQSRETAREIIALRPEGVRIYPTVVLRGTELEARMNRGEYTPQGVEEAVALCGELYEMFLKAELPVLRVGLNPTEALSGGEAVAGAYHPALGELVLSELYLRRARALLLARPDIKRAVLSVHPRRVSVMVGQHRKNLEGLRGELGLESLGVCPEAPGLWDIFLGREGKSC